MKCFDDFNENKQKHITYVNQSRMASFCVARETQNKATRDCFTQVVFFCEFSLLWLCLGHAGDSAYHPCLPNLLSGNFLLATKSCLLKMYAQTHLLTGVAKQSYQTVRCPLKWCKAKNWQKSRNSDSERGRPELVVGHHTYLIFPTGMADSSGARAI